jgi:hypothetical protein
MNKNPNIQDILMTTKGRKTLLATTGSDCKTNSFLWKAVIDGKETSIPIFRNFISPSKNVS